MLKSLVFLVGLMTVACASTHPGQMLDSTEEAVKVSVLKNNSLSDKYYAFYEYTIENTTSEWKDIKVKSIHFDGQDTEILTDDKLSSWIEGAELKLKAANYNRDLLLGSMVLVGGVTAMGSKNSGLQKVGLATMAAGSVAAGATGVSVAHQSAVTGAKGLNQTVNVPQNHIYVPSKIAPESYIKRWIVVRIPPVDKSSETSQYGNNLYYTSKLITEMDIDQKKDVTYSSKVRTGSAYEQPQGSF